MRLDDIRAPILAVTFADDYIVPWQGAAAILEKVKSEDARHLHLPGGHVGAVVSSHARKRLWPELSDFWTERDAPSLHLTTAGPGTINA